jgi:hypothetical protein
MKKNGAALLRAWMQKNKIGQVAAANAIGCSQQNVSRWLAGANPDIDWAIPIESATGIPVSAWEKSK